MMSMYGGQGMGSSGTGMNGGASPGLAQMLAALSAGGGPGSSQFPPPPTPMAAYVGGPGMGMGGGGGMAPPMAPPVGMPQPQGMPAATPGMGNMEGMMKLLAMLKGQQSGVAPAGQQGGVLGLNGYQGQQPQQMAPGADNATLSSILRSLGMFGGATGGAPT